MKTSKHLIVAVALVASVMSSAGCGSSGGGGKAGSGGGGGSGGAAGTGGTVGETVSVGGIAWSFTLPGKPYGRIDGATVSVLEMPELTTVTDADGAFTIDRVPVGAQATFVLEHEDHPLTYTKTFTLSDSNIDDLTFQIPNNGLFSLIEMGLEIVADPNKCQIVSTFTRFGKTIGDPGHHGQAGAVLRITPGPAGEEDPIYFNDMVLPDRNRTYSSLDGGVLLLNVEPGDYTLSASCVEDPTDVLAEYPPEDYPDEDLRCLDEEVEFDSLLMKCRANVFLNASPSYGLQAHE